MQDLALFRARFILFARKLQDTCKKILHVQDLAQLAIILHVLARRFYLGNASLLSSKHSSSSSSSKLSPFSTRIITSSLFHYFS